jgi:flagellar hook-associated protein 3 FlgL
MRVTNEMIYNSVNRQIQNNTKRLLDAQEVMSSQKKINRVSDDPLSSLRIFELRHNMSSIEQYLRNIDRVNGLQEAYDSTLDQALEVVIRMKELAISQASSAAASDITREAVAVELISLRQDLLNTANYRLGNQYIFSGSQSSSPAFSDISADAAPGAGNSGAATVEATVSNPQTIQPGATYQLQFHVAPAPPFGVTYDVIDNTDPANPFTVSSGNAYVSGQDISFAGLNIRVTDGAGPPPPPVTPQDGDVFDVTVNESGVYQGDTQDTRIEIENDRQVIVNLTGDTVFQGVGVTGGEDIFQLVDDAIEALRTNDTLTLDATLDRFDQAIDQLSTKRALVGARQNTFSAAALRHERIFMGFQSLKSSMENIDIAEAISNFNEAEMAYQATLSAGAKTIQPSLLDFL